MRKVLMMTFVAGFCAAAVSGCGPEGPTKADTGLAVGAVAGGILGSAVGRGKGRIAGGIVGAVAGGIVGSEIGKSMDEQDRILAQQAEYKAFEHGEAGQPVRWQNAEDGRYGEVVPTARYRRDDQDCRDYSHTIYIDGRPRVARGTACRGPDGSWRTIS
ncbi:MAG: RT0821/Lpp0805 family surface protein [Hyphomicrobiaceae bacterium]